MSLRTKLLFGYLIVGPVKRRVLLRIPHSTGTGSQNRVTNTVRVECRHPVATARGSVTVYFNRLLYGVHDKSFIHE
jgi:hypothetical protein